MPKRIKIRRIKTKSKREQMTTNKKLKKWKNKRIKLNKLKENKMTNKDWMKTWMGLTSILNKEMKIMNDKIPDQYDFYLNFSFVNLSSKKDE